VEDTRSRLGWRSAARASVERARVHNDDGDDVPQRLLYLILRLSTAGSRHASAKGDNMQHGGEESRAAKEEGVQQHPPPFAQ
jgi:hypothetical protein